MSGRIKHGTGRKNVYSTEHIISRAAALGKKFSVGKTKSKTENQYVVTIDATRQGDVKALLGEILQLISIIQDYFQGKAKKESESSDMYVGGSSNGPDSPVINITFVFNINNYNGTGVENDK